MKKQFWKKNFLLKQPFRQLYCLAFLFIFLSLESMLATETIVITDKSQTQKAIFVPSKGMNFISFQKGDIEAIDQSTKTLFDEKYAGLGAMIGPHFHHRTTIAPVKNEALFPHIAKLKAKGIKEPFSHGIGRYAPWTVVEQTSDRILAQLSGKDTWNGVPIAELEGQDFIMEYEAKMLEEGLMIRLSIVSSSPSVVGLHTYYALNGDGKVTAKVKDIYRDKEIKKIPNEWTFNQNLLTYHLQKATDFGFFPFSNPLSAEILLETKTHDVRVHYSCADEENSWQLWHPEGASFVCIEPLSAKDPRNPKLKASSLKILISIDEK